MVQVVGGESGECTRTEDEYLVEEDMHYYDMLQALEERYSEENGGNLQNSLSATSDSGANGWKG